MSVPPPKCLQKPLVVPHRHMFGPGPSNVPPRILEAGAKPVIGHMHPEIFEVTDGLTCKSVQEEKQEKLNITTIFHYRISM